MRTKIISVMTALLLCVSMFSTTAFAYVEGDANAEDTTEAEVTTDTAETEAEATEDDSEPTLEVTVSEDGTTTYTYGDWTWTVDGDEETEDEEETTTLTGTVVDITSYLNLRSGAGMDYGVIGKLTNGTEVDVIGEENGWYQVTVNGQTGYVYSDYLEVTETATEETEEASGFSDLDESILLMMFSLLAQNSTDTDDTSLALTPDGNLSLIDDIDTATDEDTGKQFITVVTKSGNYFYIIIDRDDEGEETVHFLNQVDEADLLALMDEEDVEEYEVSVSGTDTDTEDTTDETDVSAVTTDEEAEASETESTEVTEDDTEGSGMNALPAVVIVVVLAAVGGFFAYTKVKGKKKEETKPDPDADYTDEDDGEDYDLPDAYDDSDYSDEDDSTFKDNEPV
ncbi:MAG: DUF4366 domain-containing protein [Oscillospiraceae bacterium]|nr:DUF4366 domain-containing protein [Oscillospiraceae bacterium]